MHNVLRASPLATALTLAGALATLSSTPARAADDARSITFYGIVDVNVARERAGSQARTGLDHGELNGTRFGVKGAMPLDSGLKALIVLEGGFDPGTGDSEQDKTLLGRQAFAGIEGDWGRITAGRQYSPAFVALDPYEATGAADRSAGMLHRSRDGAVEPGYRSRFDNMVKYRSPDFSGFSMDLGYWFGEENSSADANERKEETGAGLAGLYSNKSFSASLVTQSYYVDKTGGKATTHGAAVAYDFGPVKAYALYSQDKESRTAGAGRAKSFTISAELRATSVDTVALSYGSRDERGAADAEDATGWSAYYLHELPKGTTLYAAYSRLTNKDAANYGFNLTPAAGEDPSVVMIGFRHKF